MTDALATGAYTHLILEAETAADLMETNPISIHETATIKEAISLLTDKGYSAVPVINEAGQSVGVVSRWDILVHDRERADYSALPGEEQDPTLVRDIMTPAIFSVTPETPAVKVIEQMAVVGVHQLFVVDHDHVLVGVIRGLHIIQHLRPHTFQPSFA
jgi:CBS domain-containing protein